MALAERELRVACFATQGSGSYDEERIAQLLAPLTPEVWPFSRTTKRSSASDIVRHGIRERPDVVVLEGTGVWGGMAVMRLARRGIPFIVSSGDAVAPFLSAQHPVVGPAARAYERRLCRSSAGFIGWTPYLVGRALTLGAPRGMTAASWAPRPVDGTDERRTLGIDPAAIVFGIAGSLNWDDRGYCYGWELVKAVVETNRPDVHVLVVGDGTGLPHLEALVAERGESRVTFTGRVARERVGPLLAAMDVGSLPQTVDGVGAFRYTTKISEYLASGLPTVMPQIPAAYDLDDGWIWRLPGDEPWGDGYIRAMAQLMETVTRDEISRRAAAVPRGASMFERDRQSRLAVQFVRDAVAAWRP